MAKRSFHVVPHEQGWALKEEGKTSPVSTFTTQKEAIEEGRNRVANDEDEVDIVVHRQDGRIRERLNFNDIGAGTTETGNRIGNGHGTTKIAAEGREKLRPADVMSVGSRVSWRALVAGIVTALSVFTLLSLVGTAVGLTILHQSNSDSLGYLPAIWGAVSLLVSMFLGGYVVTQTTVGETREEAALYGVLLWGSLMVTTGILSAMGTSAVFNSQYGPFGRTGQYNRDYAAPKFQEHNADKQTTQGTNTNQNTNRNVPNPVTGEQDIPYETVPVAWISVASAILSLLAAIGGALLGAGPELVFLQRMHGRRGGMVRTGTTSNVRAVDVKEPVAR